MATGTFFGYANLPNQTRETLANAVQKINDSGAAVATSWESLLIAGRVIIKRIFEAIEGAAACAFDVSTLNQNVLFELGYAIARAKPVWLTIDGTDKNARTQWREFQLLRDIGYVNWSNHGEIVGKFLSDRPDLSSKPLYDDLIDPSLGPKGDASIFYAQAYHPTDAAQQISRRLDTEIRRGIRLVSADPTESALNPLEWYAARIYETTCCVVHFEAPRRDLADLHNPRSAFVAGMAAGLDRPLLLLAEEDYSPPLDYGSMLKVYTSARECQSFLDEWIQAQNLQQTAGARLPRVRLATELRALRFGEHVAENERDALSDYFVDTAAFDDVVASRNALFIGRKGTGKTATMYQAAARLDADARNLVVIIKPASYEFSGLMSQISNLSPSLQQYSIEALWKFLLTSELAKAAVELLEQRVSGVPYSEDERKLLTFVESTSFGLMLDFSSRFESTIHSLDRVGLTATTSDSSGRNLLNEALHSEAIARLRSLLGAVLKGRRRVAILIDNLDKGWDRSADLKLLSHLLLGLLSAIGRVKVDFDKEDYWRDKVALTVATFLRADIYQHLITVAREPDKIPGSIVAWNDPEVLLRMLEERFLAARPEGTRAEELWTRFFVPEVDGYPMREYLTRNILPRPRDLIYLCNASIIRAADRGDQRVEVIDVETARVDYSQFAFESLLVENGITIAEFKEVLFEFLGEPWVLYERDVRTLITRAGIDAALTDHVVRRLQEVSFLGLETKDGHWEYPDVGHPFERAAVLARKVMETRGDSELRFCVHPAYRPYLAMTDPELTRLAGSDP